MKLPFILLLLLSNLSITLTQKSAQLTESKNGKEAVKMLSKGTLIVRLSRFENAIEKVSVYEGEQKGRQEEERIAAANRNLIKEFENDYSFSALVFAYEVELYEYLQDSSPYVFLNDQLKIDSSIMIKGPIFILASQGNSLYNLYDKNYSLIEKPNIEYTSHHFRRKYHFFFSKFAQDISTFFSKKIPVSKFNEKLFFYLES